MTNRRYYQLATISIMIFLFIVNSLSAQSKYKSSETEIIINKMITAHGGMTKWKNAPAISYDNVFFNPFAGPEDDPWWVSHEVIDQKTRRSYHLWPIYNGILAYDGKQVWTKDWPIGNPPNFMPLFFYYFLNLPWITQDDNVVLGKPGKGRLPGEEKEYLTIEMTFSEAPAIGKTIHDSFILYIDPDNYILKGYHYFIGYGAMLDLMGLPKELNKMGPIVRVFQNFTWVNDLLLPTRFYSTNSSGETIYGHHVVLNYSFSENFDESKLTMPEGAVIDTSLPVRAK